MQSLAGIVLDGALDLLVEIIADRAAEALAWAADTEPGRVVPTTLNASYGAKVCWQHQRARAQDFCRLHRFQRLNSELGK